MFVHHIAITVKNLDESIEFYRNVFAFELQQQYEKGNARFAYLQLGDFQIELWEFSPVKQASDLEALDMIGLRHLAFAVQDIDLAVTKAKELGVEFSEPKMGASGKRYSLGVDCNGISLELLEIKNN